MAYLAVRTDSDVTSGAVYVPDVQQPYFASAQQRRVTEKVRNEPIRRAFKRPCFQIDPGMAAIVDDNGRALITQSNVLMWTDETAVNVVAAENFLSVQAYGFKSGQAVIMGAGQAVIAVASEGESQNWTIPTWTLLTKELPSEQADDTRDDTENSLAHLQTLTDQIQTFTPLSRSSSLDNLAKRVETSPKLSKREILKWARRLAKDITGAND
jgi:hypothetical protein